MPLARYIVFRVVVVVPILVGVLTLVFLLSHALPTNPAVVIAGIDANEETLRAIKQQLGLDKSLGAQFVDYLSGIARGDFGESFYTHTSVRSELLARLPSTFLLVSVSLAMASALGIGFAIMSADRQGGIRDYSARALGTLGTAVPDYLWGLLGIIVLYSTLQWVPAPVGQAGPDAPEISRPTGAYLADAIAARNLGAIGVGVTHLILPATALALVFGAPIYRVARAAIEDALRGPYIDYAVMMGGSRRYIARIVVENALPPILTISGIIYSHLLGGAVIIEIVFSWGGMGQYAVEAITKNDYFATQAFVVFVAFFSVVVYLVVDVIHVILDPRARITVV